MPVSLGREAKGGLKLGQTLDGARLENVSLGREAKGGLKQKTATEDR